MWSPNLDRVERQRVILAGRVRYEIDYFANDRAEVWILQRGYWSLIKHSLTHRQAHNLACALDPRHTI